MVMVRSSVVALAMVVSIAAVDPIRQALSSSERDFTEQAYMALRAGQQKSAVEIYSEAIRRYPDSYMSYYRRGITFARDGQLAPALADLDAAVRLSPAVKTSNELGLLAWNSLLPETHALNMVVLVRGARADVLRQLNRHEDAIADLTAAIALDPRRTQLWHSRGLLYMETGNAKAAIADFDALLARRENVDWRFARGISHFAAGNYAEAETDFTRALELDRNNGLFARWLARAQKRRGIPV